MQTNTATTTATPIRTVATAHHEAARLAARLMGYLCHHGPVLDKDETPAANCDSSDRGSWVLNIVQDAGIALKDIMEEAPSAELLAALDVPNAEPVTDPDFFGLGRNTPSLIGVAERVDRVRVSLDAIIEHADVACDEMGDNDADFRARQEDAHSFYVQASLELTRLQREIQAWHGWLERRGLLALHDAEHKRAVAALLASSTGGVQ